LRCGLTFYGQGKGKGCAPTDNTVHVYPATMLFRDDRSGYREPLASTASDRLGRKEGVENLFQVLSRNTAAIVRNGYRDLIARSRSDDRDASRGGILPGLGERMRGIDDQIEESLVQLPAVPVHL